MKNLLITVTFILIAQTSSISVAGPKEDLKNAQKNIYSLFPGVKLDDYGLGVSAIDLSAHKEWKASEKSAPYGPGIKIGEKLFKKYGIGSCFRNGGIAIRQHYPYFDKKTGKVKTLESEIMACLRKKGVDTMTAGIKFKKGKLVAISAYMAYTSRGKKLNVVVPNDERALKIYNLGKRYFYTKRGKNNFSCQHCHESYVGLRLRTTVLSPAVGQAAHFPVYRKKWALEGGDNPSLAGFGSIQRRYIECIKLAGAKPFEVQGDEATALEYFHSYLSNGITIRGPIVRKYEDNDP